MEEIDNSVFMWLWETGSACSFLLVSAMEPPLVLRDKPGWRAGSQLGWAPMALPASGGCPEPCGPHVLWLWTLAAMRSGEGEQEEAF